VGDCTKNAAFWSQALTIPGSCNRRRQAAPLTKPKKRPLFLATVAGDPYSWSRCRTVSALVGPEAAARQGVQAETALAAGATTGNLRLRGSPWRRARRAQQGGAASAIEAAEEGEWDE